MDKFRFTPYNRLSLVDSRGMAFKCESGNEYRVNYNSQLSGPNVIKRPGERVFWTLFFGGIPRYIQENEIEKRKNTTLTRMSAGSGIILDELCNYTEKTIFDEIDSLTDKEAQKERHTVAEDVLYDPNNLGLAEHLIRPEVGMRLAAGFIVFNRKTEDKKLQTRSRMIVSDSPISEIYCLSK